MVHSNSRGQSALEIVILLLFLTYYLLRPALNFATAGREVFQKTQLSRETR